MINLQKIFRRKRVIVGAVSIIILGIIVILFLTINGGKDKFNVDVLYPMIGLKKQVVLDKLNIKNAEVKPIGIEEYYTAKAGKETVEVIFTNGLCSGYRKTFTSVKSTNNEIDETIKKLNGLYRDKLSLVVLNSKLSYILSSTEGIKSMKLGDHYFEEWKLPRNSENEKVLLGEKVNEFYGGNIQVNLLKTDNYLVTVKYVVNRNK